MNLDLKKVACVILAAGKGVRMKSDLPKVLHRLAGKPLLSYVLDTVQSLGLKRVAVVVGYQGEKVVDLTKSKNVEIVWQREQLGTGHAVMQAEPLFSDFQGDLLVLYGDVPLIRAQTIIGLIEIHRAKKAKATVLTAILGDPKRYGRIVRKKDGTLDRIVEDKDATPEEKKIKEINSGEICFSSPDLFGALKKVKKDNLQKEYYLTDVLKILREKGETVEAVPVKNRWETEGINSTLELKQMEEYLSNKRVESGVNKLSLTKK